MHKSFYHFTNNSFLKTNLYFNDDPKSPNGPEIAMKSVDKETLFLNNQKIGNSIEKLKNLPSRNQSNQSLPKLSKTTEGFIKENRDKEYCLFLGNTKNQNKLGETVENQTSRKSPSLMHTPLETSKPKRPKISIKCKTLPDEIDSTSLISSEKRVIASVKLSQARLEVRSRSPGNRNPSYITDAQNSIMSAKLRAETSKSSFWESPRNHMLKPFFQAITSEGIKADFDQFKNRSRYKTAVGDTLNTFSYFPDQKDIGEPRLKTESFSKNELSPSEYYLSDSIFKRKSSVPTSLSSKNKKGFEFGNKKRLHVPRMWVEDSLEKDDIPDFSNEDQLLTEFRKEIPNIDTEAPGSRENARKLTEWMEEKIKSVSKQSIHEKEKFEKYDKIYNLCLNEIIRELSIDCFERGDLIYRIWMFYIQLLAQIKHNIELENHKALSKYHKESLKFTIDNEDLLMKKNEEIEKLKANLEKIEKEKEEDAQKIEAFTIKELKHKEKVEKFIEIYEKMKSQIKNLSEENHFFKIKQERKQEYGIKFGNHFLESPTKLQENVSNKKKKKENGAIDSDESHQSESNPPSLDFIYDDLNDGEKIDGQDEKKDENQNDNINEAEAQTHLFLLNTKYDLILDNQNLLDDILLEFRLRFEVDKMFEGNNFLLDDFTFKTMNNEFTKHYPTNEVTQLEDNETPEITTIRELGDDFRKSPSKQPDNSTKSNYFSKFSKNEIRKSINKSRR